MDYERLGDELRAENFAYSVLAVSRCAPAPGRRAVLPSRTSRSETAPAEWARDYLMKVVELEV